MGPAVPPCLRRPSRGVAAHRPPTRPSAITGGPGCAYWTRTSSGGPFGQRLGEDVRKGRPPGSHHPRLAPGSACLPTRSRRRRCPDRTSPEPPGPPIRRLRRWRGVKRVPRDRGDAPGENTGRSRCRRSGPVLPSRSHGDRETSVEREGTPGHQETPARRAHGAGDPAHDDRGGGVLRPAVRDGGRTRASTTRTPTPARARSSASETFPSRTTSGT